MTEVAGSTILEVDVILVATLPSAVATFAMFVALYSATTVRDPMARRVKALNVRREQPKIGITASARRQRKSLVRKHKTTDRMRSFPISFNTLQDGQLQKAQQRSAQAGIRSKDLAIAVIFTRLVLPISYKAPNLYVSNMVTKRSDEIRKGLPDALDLPVIAARMPTLFIVILGPAACSISDNFAGG